jgi:hypothetical protein
VNRVLAVITALLFSMTVGAADTGPFQALTQDSAIVTDVRFEDGNVWIMLAPEHASHTIIVRISNRNRDFYRPWFNGEIDLVSTGPRGAGTWSDRVQTQANYIEYWAGDTLILHLERNKSPMP